MNVVETGGLSYYLKLAVGYPNMITINLDVENGLLRRAIDTLKYIESLTKEELAAYYEAVTLRFRSLSQSSSLTGIRRSCKVYMDSVPSCISIRSHHAQNAK